MDGLADVKPKNTIASKIAIRLWFSTADVDDDIDNMSSVELTTL